MKKSNEQIDLEVERTLSTFDRIERMPGNPFLYTRVMEQVKTETGKKREQALGTPVWKLALVTTLLLLNTYTLWQTKQQQSTASPLSTLGEEYGLYDVGSSIYNLE